jgi:hypothetical protein
MSTFKTILQTIIISSVFLLVLYIISTGNYFIGNVPFELDPAHVFVALIPFIILLIVSGHLKEIRGPGGLSILMRDEVRKPVSLELSEMELDVKADNVMPKAGLEDLRTAQNPPNTLSFQIGKKDFYGQWAIQEYIQVFDQYASFRNILFIDEHGAFKGFMSVSDFRVLLQGGDIVRKIESGQILEDPRVIKTSIQRDSTNQLALREMERVGKNMLAVVDRHEKFVCVKTQEEVVRKILTKVLREA